MATQFAETSVGNSLHGNWTYPGGAGVATAEMWNDVHAPIGGSHPSWEAFGDIASGVGGVSGSVNTVARTRPRSATPLPREVSPPATTSFGFTLRQGYLNIILTGVAPNWLYPVLAAIQKYLTYEPGWDSYGGDPLTDAAAAAGIQLLSRVMRPTTPVPSIVPGSDGGVQFEWHVAGGDLEINVSGDGSAGATFDAGSSGARWQRDRIEGELPLLAGTIASLS